MKWKGQISRAGSEVVISDDDKNTINRKMTLFLSLGSFAFSLLFLSQNITGSVVGNFSTDGANWLGGMLFVLSVIAALVYVQDMKR
jgi:hypothetical protein